MSLWPIFSTACRRARRAPPTTSHLPPPLYLRSIEAVATSLRQGSAMVAAESVAGRGCQLPLHTFAATSDCTKTHKSCPEDRKRGWLRNGGAGRKVHLVRRIVGNCAGVGVYDVGASGQAVVEYSLKRSEHKWSRKIDRRNKARQRPVGIQCICRESQLDINTIR